MEPYKYATSCAPCRRRKIRCGCVKPCASCVRRNKVAECYSEDVSVVPTLPKIEKGKAREKRPKCTRVISGSLSAQSDDISGVATEPLSGVYGTRDIASCSRVVDLDPGEERNATNIEWIARFPPMDVCEAATYTYITEIQWQMVTVDRRMTIAIRNFLGGGKATQLEQAFILVILAITGRCAPTYNACLASSSLRSLQTQHSFMSAASSMTEANVASSNAAATNRIDDLMKSQIELLIASYCLLEGSLELAYRHTKRSVMYAESAGILEASLDAQSSAIMDSAEREDALRFRLELGVRDIWLAGMVDQLPAPQFEDIQMYQGASQDQALEAMIRHNKLKSLQMTMQMRSLLDSSESIDDEWASKVLAHDSKYDQFLEAIDFDYPNTAVITRNTFVFRKLFTSNAVRLYVLSSRCQHLQILCAMSITSYGKLLQTARDMLHEVSKTLMLLRTPWRTIARMAKSESHAEVSMSIFASAVQETGCTTSSSSPSVGTSSNHPILTDFVSSFNAIYNMLNHLGSLGPWSLQCAQMLKIVPVKRPLALERGSSLDVSGAEEETASYHADVAQNL